MGAFKEPHGGELKDLYLAPATEFDITKALANITSIWVPNSHDGAWLSHFSQISKVSSRPLGPQFTNAPANFGEFEVMRDAASVSP